MRLYKFAIIALFLGVIPCFIYAQRGLDAPMTKAVMRVYQNLLEEDPQDYETYYHRACEYYKHNEYSKALSDINNALKYTPEPQISLKVEQLILRANIYEGQGNLNEALNDLNSAYNLDPSSYIVLYQKANIEYQLEKYTEAKADYLRMQRINNRSQEALIGLARIAVKENNYGLANEYSDQAVDIDPSQADIYVRRASVKSMMGNYNGAVDDLILAISTDNNNTKALQELVALSNTNYPAVASGLSNAIRQAPKVGMFYYIRAVIAESHHKYLAAISDYKKIIYENLYNYSGIYNSIAKCYYSLGNYVEALDNVDYALSASKKNKEYFLTKAKILSAFKNSIAAIECCNSALAIDANHNDALLQKSLAQTELGEYENATALLGEITLNDDSNAYAYLQRAWILDKFMKQNKNAQTFYNRVISLPSNDIKSYKGFAYHLTGDNTNALTWIQNVLAATKTSDGYEYYIATCFYALCGDNENALKCMEIALQKGYANYHDWVTNTDGCINVAPIRELPKFKEILSQYSTLFN